MSYLDDLHPLGLNTIDTKITAASSQVTKENHHSRQSGLDPIKPL